MPLDVDDVLQLLAELADDDGLKVTVTESLKGGLITGLTAVVGGMLMGPAGLAIGGALGGTAAAYSAHGKFESVGSVIRRMDDAKRKILYNRAMTIFNKFSLTDIVTLNALMAGEMAIRADLIGVVIEHLHDSLALEVQK
ncbi:hypothetical protein NP493_54g00037 [Ridgeia piscesae]|uniref:Uncharacterized protein n=1 Tax=Ridgeia piscesae TaxID=27915 RepID=A0AAD9PAV1_RIDPI|nr:hypothetical protein NP493_54g00037 [Ridgeia piscesae]